MELILALDAGTTGVRTVAFDPDLQIVDETYLELTQYFPAPGEVEHDPHEIAQLAVTTLRDVASRARDAGHHVAAIGLTNQRETTVGFDRENGKVFQRAIVWQDRRTADLCRELEERGHGDVVRTTTGLVLDSYFSATKMKWMLERGLADDAFRPSFSTIDTWLLWVLSGGVDGGVFVTEPSNASRTSLMDLATLDWSPAMSSIFGVPRSMLADVRASASAFCVVSGDVVPELAGVAITGVLGDQQSALFGQACFTPGLVKATYGTGAFILANAGDTVPIVVKGLLSTVAWDLGAFGPTSYALEGSAFVAGAAVQWLRDLDFIKASSELESLALSVRDSAGVQFVPAFTGLGSPFWNSDARGAIMGLSRGVGKGEIARAMVEALAYQVRAMTDAFRDGGVEVQELRADGGAAAMDLLLQLQATNSRVDVLRSSSLEATARGAASVAGLEVGLWSSLEELSERWHGVARFHPEDPTVVDAGYESWRRALDRA
ncbi:MAG TPA: glycerol kinase GlpK [Acidimicrobiales bacterium]|jgi:glycerol kinase|nr:glycerol kinase GlpK [Acidimicrobiales bacterium]